MSTDSLLKELITEISTMRKKLDFLVSEKTHNEDVNYVKAMSEAKKGNGKVLREYTKRRAKAKGLIN